MPPPASPRRARRRSMSPAPRQSSATTSPSESEGENLMPLDKVEKIWMDGEFVDWDDANIHILTHSLHYGSGVFEGIRAYPTSRGPAVFRLTDHINRMFASAKVFLIDIPFTPVQLVEDVRDKIRINGLEKCYIKPIAYLG